MFGYICVGPCLGVCVCVLEYMCVCVRVHVCVCAHAHTYMSGSVCVCVHTYMPACDASVAETTGSVVVCIFSQGNHKGRHGAVCEISSGKFGECCVIKTRPEIGICL